MADTSNVVINNITETSEIAIGINDINEVWMGGNLLWQKGGGTADSWVAASTDYVFMVEYTPSVTMTVATFSTIQDQGGPFYNYVAAIFESDKSQVSSMTGNSGVSIVSLGTVAGKEAYKHTKDYGTSGPTLTAGTTYYLGLGERYGVTHNALSNGDDEAGPGAKVLGWSLTANPCQSFVDVGADLYLEVTAL